MKYRLITSIHNLKGELCLGGGIKLFDKLIDIKRYVFEQYNIDLLKNDFKFSPLLCDGFFTIINRDDGIYSFTITVDE